MKVTEVAIGVILDRGRVLIARRGDGVHLAGMWEFPGGKCEPGESPAEAVRREVREELGIEIEVVRALSPIAHTYPTVRVRLHPFLCRIVEGTPRPLSATEVRWVEVGRLCEQPLPEANALLLAELAGLDLAPADS